MCIRDSQDDVNELITRLTKITNDPKNYPYIRHQKQQHGNIPLWVMMKALTLGTCLLYTSLVTVTYASDVTFEIITMDMASLTEISREGTDKESIKKQTSVLIFGSSQDTYHWTADKVVILRWK